ncbi:MAG: hypothetical protein SYR96_31345 [Actinomycetota bacterium]|nr:hypothetical protein [Actinomycetota bacterium]
MIVAQRDELNLNQRAGTALGNALEQAATAVARAPSTASTWTTSDPTVLCIRAAAELLGEDVWIAVRLPGAYEGADDLDDGTASQRWTTVVTHPDELGWLRAALQAIAEEPDKDADGREP